MLLLPLMNNIKTHKNSFKYLLFCWVVENFIFVLEKRFKFFNAWVGGFWATWREFYGIFFTLSVVIRFSTGTLGIFATLAYVFTMRVVINDILSMTINPTLSTTILFCNLCYILLWISPRSVVKIAIRI